MGKVHKVNDIEVGKFWHMEVKTRSLVGWKKIWRERECMPGKHRDCVVNNLGSSPGSTPH